jgi:Protein of unknown function (DUF1566)
MKQLPNPISTPKPFQMKKIFIIISSIIFIVWTVLSILRLGGMFLLYADIADWVGINLNLDYNFSVILAIVLTAAVSLAFPYFLLYFAFGRHQNIILLITLGFAVTVAFLLYTFGQDVYFHPRTGEPMKYYASTLGGVIFSTSPGFDKKFKTELKPVIPEIIASLENQKKGITPKRLEFNVYTDDFSAIEFFNPVNGSPEIFYYELPDGTIELFNSAGIHPQYQEPLTAISKETIPKLKRYFEALQTNQSINTSSVGDYLVKDEIAIDKTTKLMWLRCSLGQQWKGKTCIGEANLLKRDKAIQIEGELASKYKWGNHNDWRVPTLEELKTIVKLEYKPSINKHVFPNTLAENYWSSTIVEDRGIIVDDYYYQVVNFSTGDVLVSDVHYKDNVYPVRLVRNIK